MCLLARARECCKKNNEGKDEECAAESLCGRRWSAEDMLLGAMSKEQLDDIKGSLWNCSELGAEVVSTSNRLVFSL